MNQQFVGKLALVNKNLRFAKSLINKESRINTKNNTDIAVVLGGFIETISKDINILPKSIKVNDIDIPAELRKIRRNATGILQAANDKVCKIKESKQLTRTLAKDLDKLHKKITEGLEIYVTASYSRQGTKVEDVKQETQKIIAVAEKPKKQILNNFSDLNTFDGFMQRLNADWNKELQRQNAEAIDHTTVVEPTPAKINLEPPPVSFKHNTYDKYNERVNESVMQTHNALNDVYQQVPKSIKITDEGFTVVKSPVIAISQHFIPNSTLAKTGFKYIRISNSFYDGYNPGLSLKSGSDNSYLLIKNQILLVFPKSILKENGKFYKSYTTVIRSLSRRLGELMCVPFGSGTNLIGDKDEKVFLANRKYYFSNPAFPSFIFCWLIPKDVYNTLSNVKYLTVNIANSPDMKDSLTQEVVKEDAPIQKPSENPLIKEKAQREKAVDNRLKDLAEVRARRQLIVGPIEVQINEIKQQRAALGKIVVAKKAEIVILENDVKLQEAQLRSANPGGKIYKALISAITVSKIALEKAKAELQAITVDQLNILELKIAKLKDSKDAAIKQLIELRKQEKVG